MAEWEYAARSGGKKEKWAGTSEEASLGEHACYYSGGKTHPVGEKRANGLGLHDISGNVWEWVQDCWHGSYQGAPDVESPWLEAGGGDCGWRVMRGGAWGSEPGYVRSANRDWNVPVYQSSLLGFRLARDL